MVLLGLWENLSDLYHRKGHWERKLNRGLMDKDNEMKEEEIKRRMNWKVLRGSMENFPTRPVRNF